MRVVNVHEREIQASPERVGALIDSLASEHDALWPVHSWLPMKLDRPIGVGARGGHGPIRYTVEAYLPGRLVKFRFNGPTGFDGFHAFEMVEAPPRAPVLRHTIEMTARGRAALSWVLVFRPMHDALLEDSLATAQASLGLTPRVHRWSLWVRLLRRLLSGGRANKQIVPGPAPEAASPQGDHNNGRVRSR